MVSLGAGGLGMGSRPFFCLDGQGLGAISHSQVTRCKMLAGDLSQRRFLRLAAREFRYWTPCVERAPGRRVNGRWGLPTKDNLTTFIVPIENRHGRD